MNNSKSYPLLIYLLGAGGIGMSALGMYFLKHRHAVAGYDRVQGLTTKMLTENGAAIITDDNPELIPEEFKNRKSNVWVIYTPAVPADLKIMEYFRINGYSIYKRAEILGRITDNHLSFTVAGTHGKTTTTAAITHILKECGVDCTGFIGGISKNFDSNFVSGISDVVVAEADEYDRSFHYLHPDYAVVTSVEPDHLDIYGNYENVIEAFRVYASNLKDGGKLLVNEKYSEIFKEACSGIITYGSDSNSDYYASNVQCSERGINFDFVFNKDTKISAFIPVFGLHNAENTVAAGAIAHQYGIDAKEICRALESFIGVKRRFDVISAAGGKMLIDDYAHHPDEIKALTATLKRHFPGKKYAALFQPHLYSRTRDFADEFSDTLSEFHTVLLLDIYPAREKPIEGVTSSMLLRKISSPEKMLVSKEQVTKYLDNLTFDILVTIGAGDIELLIPTLKTWMSKRYEC